MPFFSRAPGATAGSPTSTNYSNPKYDLRHPHQHLQTHSAIKHHHQAVQQHQPAAAYRTNNKHRDVILYPSRVGVGLRGGEVGHPPPPPKPCLDLRPAIRRVLKCGRPVSASPVSDAEDPPFPRFHLLPRLPCSSASAFHAVLVLRSGRVGRIDPRMFSSLDR